ncbi:hypothetical protein BO71DRAFT_352437 [Aspergillus ellipticus CBS 707.79]|uniref:BZIP domain-containing protein n=1 Tax=Aspergillus ellipticus CBS 707.79 TaxID=1448320 RepID=A0A319DBU5_9EURO|nr:hypothetical protein BO71DRAFT_352437 [Aspergillus ellipticus CBS 707.79]
MMKVSASATQLQPGADERRLRKKIQNRLNQRARRLRVKKEKPTPENCERAPYKVHRWRLEEPPLEDATPSNIILTLPQSDKDYKHDESHSSESDSTSPSSSSSSSSTVTTTTTTTAALSIPTPPTAKQPQEPTHTLPADHLLHLIYFNAFRGFYQNKLMLADLALSLTDGPDITAIIHHGLTYPMDSIIVPITPGIPECLIPTQSQSSLTHSCWIDVIPFPRIRENLITWESCFDHRELVKDLVGSYVHWMSFHSPSSVLDPAVTGRIVLLEGDDDEVTTSRKGFLVWGEPHRAESWEVTPGFLRKWSWVVEGCEELIEYSNRWRMVRGEEPMRVSLCG